ncbi:MAG: type II secretion system protein [Deltaproteobacteria bacterium]|nr:type II secretion system protein [Deltaproteobacteria bacterium]
MDMKRKKKMQGFTLIEVIVSLIVASILGAMLISFMGTTVVQSANPVIQAQNGAYINQIMENMTADYKYLVSTSGTPMTTFIARIGAEGSEQTYYTDAGHPYAIVHNRRVSFPAGSSVTETPDAGGKILKVTVRYQGLTLTALFSE